MDNAARSGSTNSTKERRFRIGIKGLMVVVGSKALIFPRSGRTILLHSERNHPLSMIRSGNVIERQMAAQDLGDASRIDAEDAMAALIQTRADDDDEVRRINYSSDRRAPLKALEQPTGWSGRPRFTKENASGLNALILARSSHHSLKSKRLHHFPIIAPMILSDNGILRRRLRGKSVVALCLLHLTVKAFLRRTTYWESEKWIAFSGSC